MIEPHYFFTPITDGEYTIMIANRGNEQASVTMLAGTNPFLHQMVRIVISSRQMLHLEPWQYPGQF